MAAARDNLSRRSLLGAAVAAPALLGAGPTTSSPFALCQRTKPYACWAKALAAYGEAEAALEDFRSHVAEPAERRWLGVRERWPTNHDFDADTEVRRAIDDAMAEFNPIDDGYAALDGVRTTALKRLLRTPAPDLRALALKIELAVDSEIWELELGEPCLAGIKAEVWEFAGRHGVPLLYCGDI